MALEHRPQVFDIKTVEPKNVVLGSIIFFCRGGAGLHGFGTFYSYTASRIRQPAPKPCNLTTNQIELSIFTIPLVLGFTVLIAFHVRQEWEPGFQYQKCEAQLDAKSNIFRHHQNDAISHCSKTPYPICEVKPHIFHSKSMKPGTLHFFKNGPGSRF